MTNRSKEFWIVFKSLIISEVCFCSSHFFAGCSWKIDVSLMKQISEECPRSCHEEFIETQMSFTSVSEESHNRAWKLWPSLPQNRTKDDALFMELFYKTLEVEVTKVEPSTFFDLLSSIGGTLGLFLGGSIFSLFEFLLVAGFFSMSMLTLFLRTALNIKTD